MNKLSLLFKFHWLKTLLLSLIIFTLGLSIGIVLSLPSEMLEQRLIRFVEQQGQISITEGSFALGVISLTANNILIAEQPENKIPAIRIDKATITPKWGSLLSSNPTVHLNSKLMSGSLIADVAKDGQVKATAKNLLLEVPLQNGWDMIVTGQVQQADLNSLFPLSKTSRTDLNVTLNNVSLREAGKDKAMINMGEIKLQAKGKGQAFRVSQLSVQNGDFDLSGQGNIRLGSTPQKSSISMRMTLKPNPSADPGLVELLKLAIKENSKGEFPLTISGNLANPKVR